MTASSGTLDLLILRALAAGGLHGYALSKWVRTASRQMLNVEDRALYIALHRLEARKLVKGRWQAPPAGRRIKQYELTPAGEARLVADISRWERYVQAMSYVLQPTVPEGACAQTIQRNVPDACAPLGMTLRAAPIAHW